MPKQNNAKRERFRERACRYIEVLRGKKSIDNEFIDLFTSLLNISGHFGFKNEEMGTTEEEWKVFSDKYFGV
tara:strand:- start:614 stop:829 length:216 start_codon:yes stop_codon:yes gene_type:complete